MKNLQQIKTIKQVQQGLLKHDFSAQELVRYYLNRIEKRNPEINSFITIFRESALQKAKDVDEKIKRNEKLLLLDGVPIAIKDNLLLAGELTTAGSKILSNYRAPYTATAVQRLIGAGAIILGKTNMDEFAMGGSGETSNFGVTKNPLDLNKVPGGSSSGSAAAVADGQCVVAIGSDTGGSIRQPAGFCGLVGFKPTYGTISRYGLIAMASSFDQIGPLTNSVEDSSLLTEIMSGQDQYDSTVAKINTRFSVVKKQNIKGKKIGLPKEFFSTGVDRQVEYAVLSAVDELQRAGAQIQEVSLPNTAYALAVYYILMPAEVSSNLARFDGVRYGYRASASNLEEMYLKTRSQGFGDEVKRRIMLGTYVLSSGYSDEYYKRALKIRNLIVNDFRQVFQTVDYLITPTTPDVAFNLNEKTADPLTMYLTDIFTVSANVAGLPAISIPCGKKENLPIGLQIMGPHFSDHDILQLADNLNDLLK